MTDRPRRLTSHVFHEALVAAGVIRAGENIRRIVIDAKAGDAVVIHLERYGDTRLLDVVRTLDGIEILERQALPVESDRPELVVTVEGDGPAIGNDLLAAVRQHEPTPQWVTLP